METFLHTFAQSNGFRSLGTCVEEKVWAPSQAHRFLSVSYLIIMFTYFSAHCCGKMFENGKETVVIIGGGIIGLTTAYELSKRFNVHLVEKR